MKRRYFTEMAYKGTAYHGWQAQENALSVQTATEKAISTIVRNEVKLTGAGRTDTGVHASYFAAHFDLEKSFFREDLSFKLNRLLPSDITIFRIREMPLKAHARFDALSRTYQYVINRRKNAFIKDLSTYIYGDLNLDEMNKAAAVLSDYSDFTSFSKLHSNNKTNICKIMQSDFQVRDDYVVFTIKADRFLRNMVRAVVAALLDVGKGKIYAQDIRDIIESADRQKARGTAPAQGLYLTDIVYPEQYRLFNPVKGKILPFI